MAVNNSAGSVGTEVVKGVIIGGVGLAAAVAAAPVLLPLVGLTAVGTAIAGTGAALPWLGAAVGGWWKYKQATTPPA